MVQATASTAGVLLIVKGSAHYLGFCSLSRVLPMPMCKVQWSRYFPVRYS